MSTEPAATWPMLSAAHQGLSLSPELGWAIAGALVVGASLGLLGSGGAILTIPILVYLVGHEEKVAIVESLAIVGLIALTSAIREAVRRSVNWPSVLLLAVPGMAGSAVGAWVSHWLSGRVQLGLLALLMLLAALFMLRRREGRAACGESAPSARPSDVSARRAGRDVAGSAEIQQVAAGPSGGNSAGRSQDDFRHRLLARPSQPWWLGIGQGFGLGVATGLVGIGGGFLIVPVLVLLRRLPMSTAVGTSLALIAFNCAAGLAQHAASGSAPLHSADWTIVTLFAAVGILGALAGGQLGARIDQRLLKRIFAAALVLVATYVGVRLARGG